MTKKKLTINLFCPICDRKYVNARYLPCNFSVCYSCIQSSTVDNVFKCNLCKKHEHEVPINGFPAATLINAQIAKEERILASRNKKIKPLLTTDLRKKNESKSNSSKTMLTLIKTEPLEHTKPQSDSVHTIKIEPLEPHFESLITKKKSNDSNIESERKPKKSKHASNEIINKPEAKTKRKMKSKALETYNRNMFMCAALNAYSKAKCYTELMFMQDFEKLLDDLKINIFDLYDEWCANEYTIKFNLNEKKFEFETEKL